MLYAKFQDNRTSGSGEEDFLRFLPYMDMAAICDLDFRSPFPRRLNIKFGFDWPSGFRGEDV